MEEYNSRNLDSESVVLCELSVKDDGFEFASSINSALESAYAELKLNESNIEESLETMKSLTPQCDSLDYILAASCGALCGIFDIFFVNKPGDSLIGEAVDKWFADRTEDFARRCGWKGKDRGLSASIRYLEKLFKVPYDQTSAGEAAKDFLNVNPKNHHFKSLAHNPTLLGLFFSILDQFITPNQSHFVDNGKIIALNDADPDFRLRGSNTTSKLFCAFVNWFGHLISDMSGSSGSKGRGMGIPSPFWSWINNIIVIKNTLGISATDFDKSLNEIAVNIYEQGYDARFQSAQAMPVFINEILTRLIYSTRRLIRYFGSVIKEERSFKRLWKECEPFSNATVKRMLTVAHGSFCLIDTSDAIIVGFATGAGAFNLKEFAMRLNIVGIGRLTISLYGEVNRELKKREAGEDVYFYRREKTIIEDYISGLEMLSEMYNDRELIAFVDDFKKSDMYKAGFEKSVKLAKIRNVSDEDILNTKEDIDKFFQRRK